MKEKLIETRNKFRNSMLGQQMVPIILDSYQRVNSLLKLYQETSVYNKFIKEWNEFKQLCRTSNKSGKKRIYFESKVDKLFDVIKCKCDVLNCSAFGCDGCEFEAHVVKCKCFSPPQSRGQG